MRVSAVTNNKIAFKSTACQKVAQNVTDIILSYRRPLPSEEPTQQSRQYLSSFIAQKILPSIQKDKPIPMVILGFPMKSSSAKKVISPLPDRSEYESLEHIKGLTQRIRSVYPNGSDFRIFSDGRVFVGTVYNSSDGAVSTYLKGCKQILRKLNATDVKIYSAEDFYTGSYDKVRQNLFSDFPVDRTQLHQKLMQTPQSREYLYNMCTFYVNDMRGTNPTISIKQAKARATDIALGVIQTSSSYNKMIRSIYRDDYLRLSVHPYPVINPDNKIGMFLNKEHIQCPTPWHSAAVKISTDDKKEHFVFDKKSMIEDAGSAFVPNIDGKGAYYQFPKNLPYDFSVSFKENLKRLKGLGKV